MMSMKRIILVGFLGILLVGCEGVYPTGGKLTEDRPQEPIRNLPPFVLDAPDVMNFKEKVRSEFVLRVSVPPPGRAVVTAYDLPPGAVFSAADFKLSWTPGKKDGDEPKMARAYIVRFVLQSSEDPITIFERSVVLVVKNVAKSFEVEAGQSLRIPMPILDADQVSIEPLSMQSVAIWSDHELLLSPRNPGVREFDLVVRNREGEERRESITVRTLSRDER